LRAGGPTCNSPGVTAAWCIATETESSLKQGNYVQGTVLLVCRKRTDAEPAFLDEISHRVEAEVRRQLDSMLALDDASEPNFADADYQLAAYAAALRVLTERPIPAGLARPITPICWPARAPTRRG
jgi:putative DNA methylase